jgi:hypothetical protein
MHLLDGYQKIFHRNVFVFAMSASDYSAFQLYQRVKEAVLIDEEVKKDHPAVFALMTEKSRYVLSPERLSKTWGIGLLAAKRTILSTTQRGVHLTLYSSIERIYPTGDRPLCYWKHPHLVFHDTLKFQVVSPRDKKCIEIYATDFGWSQHFPMRGEADVHDTLELFLNRFCMPESLISD